MGLEPMTRSLEVPTLDSPTSARLDPARRRRKVRREARTPIIMRLERNGAGDGTRTHDLPLTRRLLWPTELRQQSRQDTQPRTRATSKQARADATDALRLSSSRPSGWCARTSQRSATKRDSRRLRHRHTRRPAGRADPDRAGRAGFPCETDRPHAELAETLQRSADRRTTTIGSVSSAPAAALNAVAPSGALRRSDTTSLSSRPQGDRAAAPMLRGSSTWSTTSNAGVFASPDP